jgi:hypothetical protein
LLIVGILAGAGMMGAAAFLDGFVTGRANADLTQKAQNALQRLVMELRFVEFEPVSRAPLVTVSLDHTAVTYTSKRDGVVHTVSRVGTELRLDGATLTDRVNAFQATYDSGSGEVRFVLGMERIGSLEASVFP